MSKQQKKQSQGQEPAEVYVVINPLTYGDPEVRHEAGAEVSDIPAESVGWLLEQGHIRPKGVES